MAKIIFMTNNNFYKLNKDNNILNNDFQKYLTENVNKFSVDAERRVCEYGNFKETKINIKNKSKDLNLKSFDLCIRPSLLLKERPKERELMICANSKDDLETYSVVLKRGEKDEILKTLQDKNFICDIEDFLKDAHNEFEHI